MDQSSNKLFIYIALGIGVISFGFAPILVLYAGDTSAVVLVTCRTIFAAVLLLPFWLNRGETSQKRIPFKEHLQVVFAGICLGLHFTLWIASLHYTSVAAASVLVTIHPIIIILVERFWFERRFAPTTWAGVAFVFAGSSLLGIFAQNYQSSFPNIALGNGLAISAAFFFAAYMLTGRQVRQKRGWINYVFPVYSFAAITCLLLLIGFVGNPFPISAIVLLVGLGLAIGPSIIGHGSMNYAVRYLSPTLLATLFLLEPLIASFFAYVIFGEVPSIFSMAAMIVVIAGIGLTWKRMMKTG